MSGPFGSSQWMYSSGGFYPTEIGQSLRFNDDDTAYLSKTFATTGSDRKKITFSFWYKKTPVGTLNQVFNNFNGTNEYAQITITSDDRLEVYSRTAGGTSYNRITSALLRDPSAWYHIFVSIDTTQATSDDRIKIYINGVLQTSFATNNVPPQNTEVSYFIASRTAAIGRRADGGASSQNLDGYLAEYYVIDGTALDPTDFGEFKSGVWVAKEYTGSYGTNGFYLNFSDSGAIGDDLSGNANDWTANNLVATDVVLDSPTQNWCVANVLNAPNSCTFSNGNLQVVTGTSSGSISIGTFQFSSGKWYWELTPISNGSNSYVGIQSATERWIYKGNGDKVSGGTTTSYGASYTTNDIIGVAIDMDAGTLTFYKNGVSQGVAFTGITGEITSHINTASWGSGAVTYVMNFGQDSSFAGNKTPQGNTDDNGVGDFYYAPPSGYLALCTANLPYPAIDPAQDDVPADYFNTVLYTGTGSAQSISVGFQPDLTLLKNRTNAFGGSLYDAVRGAGLRLGTPSTDAEIDYTSSFISFDTGGFSIAGGNGEVNQTSAAFVSWNWLAGNGTSSNTDGSISSTVSVNQKAGFSIVSYTGTGSNATVGHGLGATPAMIIGKNRSVSGNWRVWHSSLTGTQLLFLNTTAAIGTDASVWNSTTPTSSVFSIGTDTAVNGNGNGIIFYCFAEVEGYSKFGSYTGNGSTDGPMIWTGFEPAVILLKSSSVTGGWEILDNARDPYNVAQKLLQPNVSNAEASSANHAVDFLSNGFKIRTSGGSDPAINTNGSTVIYAAWASNPFKYANAR
jgi:hypothetical protein